MNKIFNFKHYDIIKDCIGDMKEKSIVHFISIHQWHSYELLLYLLSITGKADVIISTFGLSEEAIRALSNAKNAGIIDKITLILNKSSKRFKRPLLFFLENIVDETYFNLIHAKIFIIENNNYKFIVNQSANFSRNPTIESGVVINSNKSFNYYSNAINSIITNSVKFNEIIR